MIVEGELIFVWVLISLALLRLISVLLTTASTASTLPAYKFIYFIIFLIYRASVNLIFCDRILDFWKNSIHLIVDDGKIDWWIPKVFPKKSCSRIYTVS